MKFVGLDLSLSSSGLAAYDGEAGTTVTQTLKTKPADYPDDLARYVAIRNGVLDFVHSHSPALICVEDFFTPQNLMSAGAAIKLAMLGAIVRTALYEEKLPFAVISPPQLKKFVLGKGNGDKSLILREVFRRWNYSAGDDNQADALGLAHIAEAVYAQVHGDVGKLSLLKPQSQVVAAVLDERPKYFFPRATW